MIDEGSMVWPRLCLAKRQLKTGGTLDSVDSSGSGLHASDHLVAPVAFQDPVAQ